MVLWSVDTDGRLQVLDLDSGELRALGASPEHALRVAGNARRWWRNSRYELNRLMPIGYFDRLGVPRLS